MASPVDFSSANVLITGGSEGIGLGFATRFLRGGGAVLVTGRSRDKLALAAERHPGLKTLVNDIGSVEGRERLAHHIREAMPELTVVINNAGIQRRVSLAEDNVPWPERQEEINILLSAPVHLNHLLIPLMLAHRRPSLIVNLTSGGAYLPQPFAPMYSASKAALHSYTVNLRFALARTPIGVVEIIPPAVRSALAGPGATHGAPLDEFCDTVFAELMSGTASEIGFGPTASEAFTAPKALYRELFEQFSGRFPVKTYV